MATHSSTLPSRIPWTEEPGRLRSMGSQRVRHSCATNGRFFSWWYVIFEVTTEIAWGTMRHTRTRWGT